MKNEIFLTFENGVFSLSDKGKTSVKRKDKEPNRQIFWSIRNSPNELDEIKDFWIEGKERNKPPYDDGKHPFVENLSSTYEIDLKLTVRKEAPEGEWEYKIWWRDHWNNPREHDPKIAVLPSDEISLTNILLSLALVSAALVGVKLFGKNIKKKLFR